MNWVWNIVTNYLRFTTSLVAMAIITPIIISNIGSEGYGMWVMIYAAIGIISLSDLGFATAAIKFLSEAEAKGSLLQRNEIAGSLCFVYLVLTSICAMFVAIIYIYELTPLPEIFALLGISTTVAMACCVHRAALIANGRQDIVNWISIVGTIFQTLLTILLLSLEFGIYGIAISHSVSLILQSLICMPFAHQQATFNPCFQNTLKHIRKIARFSIWALIANTSFLIILRVDPLIIEHLLSFESVAIFAVALKISEQMLLFNKQFSNAIMPLISRFQGSALLETRAKLLHLSTKYLMAFATPVLCLLSIDAYDLINLWVGPEFSEAAQLLSVLCVAVYFSTIQFNAANVNGMSGHPHFVAGALSASAVIKLTLSFLLITSIGLKGAVIATLIATICCESTLNIMKACEITKLSPRDYFTRALCPGLICSIPSIILAMGTQTHESFFSLFLVNGLYGALSLTLFYVFFVNAEENILFRKLLSREVQTPCIQSITP